MNELEIFELLRKQEEEIRKQPVYYVYYDKSTYRIISLKNYLDEIDVNPYIKFAHTDFDFTSPGFNIVNYIIDPNEKKLKKIEDELIQIKTIDDYIYEIPKVISDRRLTYADRSFDLLIEQNNSLKEFRIKLSKNLKEKFSLQNMFSQDMAVYVTEISDPNILYKTLKFSFGDVIFNEYYTIPFEDFKGNATNVYALRYFENYLHVDVRNDK